MADQPENVSGKQKVKAAIYKTENSLKRYFGAKGADIYTRFVRRTILATILSVAIAVGIVFVIIYIKSAGMPLTKVPSVVGMNVVDAAIEIEKMGLIVQIDTKFDNSIERFVVADQYPKFGITVREGRTVKIIVSMGKDTYEAPRLVGMSVPEAEKLLREAGIPFQKTIIQTEDFVTNVVISQNIPAGTEVDRSVKLQIVVNSDLRPSEYRIMDYTQKQAEYVVTQLYDDGVIPVLEKVLTDKPELDGIIISQSIAPETIIPKNTTVRLQVGVYGEDSIERDRFNYYVFRYFIPSMSYFTNGLLPQQIEEIREPHVIVTIEDETGKERDIYDKRDTYNRWVTVVFKALGRTKLDLIVNNQFMKETTYGY